MADKVVGARELKTRLGTYLRRVRGGETLLVTDRGEPVAELRPILETGGTRAALLRLAKIGAITLPTRKGLKPFRPIRSKGPSISEAIREEREDRF